MYNQLSLEVKEQLDQLQDEKRNEVEVINEELNFTRKKLENEMDLAKTKLSEKDRQIKDLKSQRDAMFEENMSNATAKKEATTMMPHIQHSNLAPSDILATPEHRNHAQTLGSAGPGPAVKTNSTMTRLQ